MAFIGLEWGDLDRSLLARRNWGPEADDMLTALWFDYKILGRSESWCIVGWVLPHD